MADALTTTRDVREFGATSTLTSRVALLTGGADKPYALGLAKALTDKGIRLDFIGSSYVDSPELHGHPLINYLNLRGDQNPDASAARKLLRLALYYLRLGLFAITTQSTIFHILWNNKIEWFDRTLLTLYYKLFAKRLTLTAHNVNIKKRDGNDSWLNRFTLSLQYKLVDHIFVHTDQNRKELSSDFKIPPSKITVIPFGINNSVPNTSLSCSEARARLGLRSGDKVLLFFGNIARYKGLEFLIQAMSSLVKKEDHYRLVIAGRPKGEEAYWSDIQSSIKSNGLEDVVIRKIEYVPDEETEIYFKAADLFVLPYTHIFQSGVLFLGYNFGLPVVASNVGSLAEDIAPGKTGWTCPAKDGDALAAAIEVFFESDLYRALPKRRLEIRAFAEEKHSWKTVATLTEQVYKGL